MANSTESGKPAIKKLGWQDKTRIIWMDTLYDTGLGAHVFIGVFGGRKMIDLSWQTSVPYLNISSKQLTLVNQAYVVCVCEHAAQLDGSIPSSFRFV